MPELAASYAFGATITFLCVLAVLFLEYQILNSATYLQLQANLNLIHKRWSDTQDKIVELHEHEGFSFFKSMGIFGVFCIFLSWLGLFFFLLVYVSIRLLSRSPRGKMLKGPLAQKPLSEIEIKNSLDREINS